MSLDNMTHLVRELYEVDQQIKKLQDRKKELDAPLRQALSEGTAGGDISLIVEDIQVELKHVKGSTTYDHKLMAEDGIDLEPYKKIGKPYTRLSLKQVVVL